jgi:hypothetical protein
MVASRIAVVLAIAALTTPAIAAQGGKAVGVKPVATVYQGGGSSPLSVGKTVFSGDRITTAQGGEAQILFPDNTRLVIGPGSSLVIGDYVATSGGSAKKLALGAAAGVFRFVSGSSKGAYSINTPSATFGIRGTAFDFAVVNRRTLLLQYQGSVNLCGRGGTCVRSSDPCDITATDARGRPRRASQDGFDTGGANLRQAFRYAFSQQTLGSGFRVGSASRCQRDIGRAERSAAQNASSPADAPNRSGRGSDRSRSEGPSEGGGFD